MADIERLKKINEAIKNLNKKRQEARLAQERLSEEERQDEEAEKLAVQMMMNEEVISTLESIRDEITKGATVNVSSPDVNIPEIKIPDIKIPEIKVPEIKVPSIPEIKIPKITVPKAEIEVKIPEIKIPDIPAPIVNMEFPDAMALKGIDKKSPLPVLMMGSDGKPFQMLSAGGGGISKTKLLAGEEKIGTVDIDDDRFSVFGELINVQLTPVFQYSFEYTVENSDLFTTVAANGGTITDSTSMAVVSTSTTTDSDACLQTKKGAKYRAGQGAAYRFTAQYTTGVADTIQLAGLAGDVGTSEAFKDGYMIGFVGDTFGVHRFYDDNRETIEQSSFDDPLDGTGKSGMRIDVTKLNVFEVRFQYLGAGKIEFAIESDKTGSFVVFHTINYTNRNTRPSVGNPNFYGTLFVDNTTTTTDVTLKSASCAYFIQGLTNLLQTHQPVFASGAITTTTTANTETAVLTVRNVATYFSKTNYIEAQLYGISVGVDANSANNLTKVRLVRNASLGGSPEYNRIAEYNSIMEKDIYGTTVTGGEDAIDIILAGQRDSKVLKVNEWELLLEPEDTWTIATTSTANATVEVSLIWKELF